jgi:prephenate dehydrogenase
MSAPLQASDAEEAKSSRAFIVGLGLIGSSVGFALRAQGWFVSGVDIDATRAARALELGAVDHLGEDLGAAIGIIATPVASIAQLAKSFLDNALCDEVIVTDVGSVKAPIVASFDHPRFVGGHPLAGSEQEGPDGADRDIFVGSTWVLTPTAQTDPAAFAKISSLVASFGAEVVALPPDRHDALVAVISHLPHLTAANLMVLASDALVDRSVLLRLAAGGFRDMTRIAAGDPAIWPDIFRDNKGAVLDVLDALLSRLHEARRMVESDDRDGLVAVLERAKSARRNLPPRVARPESLVEMRVPVLDRPGSLAEVTTVLGELAVNIFDLEIAHSAEGARGVLVLSIDSESSEAARAALGARGYRPAMRRLG